MEGSFELPSEEDAEDIKKVNAEIAGYKGSDEDYLQELQKDKVRHEEDYIVKYTKYWDTLIKYEVATESRMALEIMMKERNGSEYLAELQE